MLDHESQELSEAIDTSVFFGNLDSRSRDRIKSACILRTFAKGEILIREGDKDGDVYLIIGGTVDVQTQNAARQVALATLGSGSIVGEVMLMTGVPRTSTVVARDPVTAVALPIGLMFELIVDHPEIGSHLEAIVEQRAMDAARKINQA